MIMTICKLLLIGDSIAAGFGGRLGHQVLNKGLVSDYPAQMDARLLLAMDRCPKGDVVIEIGVNRTKAHLKYHISYLHKMHDKIASRGKHMYLLEIPSTFNKKVGALNEYYSFFARYRSDVTFLPLPKGVRRYLMKDRVHVKRAGYVIWSNYLKKRFDLGEWI
jgi:hypothetical protein